MLLISFLLLRFSSEFLPSLPLRVLAGARSKWHVYHDNFGNKEFKRLLFDAKVTISSTSNEMFDTSNISNCIFADLRGYEHGGAVFVKNEEVGLYVYNSLFIGCSASLSGGAIYVKCPRYDLEQSTFMQCFVSDAAWTGQSFYSASNIVNITASTVFMCPPDAPHRGSEAIFIITGVQSIVQLNSSYNTAAQYAGGLATQESLSLVIRRCMFYHDISPNHVLALIHLRPDDDISCCNFVKNLVYNEGLLYLSGGYAVMRKCYFKKNDGVLAVFNSAYGPGYLTLEECSIDVPEHIVMEGQYNLFNLGSTFTKKPSKNVIPKNVELKSDNLTKMLRYINTK